jgi:DNA-binding HxlR family transcriptional regulator
MPLTSDNSNHSDASYAAIITDMCPLTSGIVVNRDYSNAAALMAVEGKHFPSPPLGSKHWLVRRLGDRWTYPIIDILRCGPMRFASLKKALGRISQRMLTLSLKKLERDGLVYRKRYPGLPPHVTYELTSSGMSLLDILAPFDHWLEANRRHIQEANKSYLGRH